MAEHSRYTTHVLGTGSAHPARVVTNQDLATELASRGIETTDAWIVERTGIQTRRLVESGNPEEFNSALAARAALRALEAAGKKPSDLDLIVYGTCTPDTQVPSSACWLQHKIGATNAAGFDVQAACSGFLYSLHIANQFIENGGSKLTLVVGSDVLSQHTNWSDRGSCILFGDGAGAVVIERGSPDAASRVLASRLYSNGDEWELFHTVGGGTARPCTVEDISSGLNKMQMRGREMFKVATRTMTDLALDLCKRAEVSLSEIDWVVPHQANLRILEAVSDRVGIPMDRFLVTIDRFGNTSGATIPTTLDDGVRSGKVKRGQLVLMVAFGAGSTSAVTLLRY